MIITNKYNLPAPLARSLSKDSYKKVGDISVTALLKPPRIRALEIRHDAEITEDVSDRIYRSLGSSLHNLMELQANPNELAEERLTVRMMGWTLSGKPDLLDPDMTLWDFKLTSVWAYILGGKTEWEQQLQIYSWMYNQHGFNPLRLSNMLLFRDYSQSAAQRMNDYPHPAMVVSYAPKPAGEVYDFICARMRDHQATEGVSDYNLPPCTSDERWEKATTYAVHKPGTKRALNGGVFDDKDAAEKFCSEHPGTLIEDRPGKCIRCDSYCRVKPWCNQAPKDQP